MIETRKVNCASHGEILAAFVCQHLCGPIEATRGIGFIGVRDDNGCINAWCNACESFLQENGGEWNDVTEGFARIKLLCEGCALERARVNGVDRVD